MKKNIISTVKILVDIAMLVLLLLLMAFHLSPNETHEWIGLFIFILFLVHTGLNYKWYLNLFKGKYRSLRIIQTVTNFLLLIAMFCCIISSILISGHVFSFIETHHMRLGRSLHLTSTIWTFILMSFHLGLHWGMFINLIKKKVKLPVILGKIFTYTAAVLALAFCAYGIYILIDRKVWEELFLLTEFKWFDFDKHIALYLFENLALMSVFIWMAYYLKKLIMVVSVYRIKKKLKTNTD